MLTIAATLLLAGTASAAAPKPWMWTAKQAAAQVTGLNPWLFGTVSHGTLTIGSCKARGNGVKARFTAFQCAGTFTGSSVNATPAATRVFVRVRRVGKGEVCASLFSFAAIPQECLAAGQARTVTDAKHDLAAAETALRRSLSDRLGLPMLYQGPTACLQWGRGFYGCYFGVNGPSDGTVPAQAGLGYVSLTAAGAQVTVARMPT